MAAQARVLYVDRDFSEVSARILAARIASLYDLVKYQYLDVEVVRTVKEALAQAPFAAIVSHVPYRNLTYDHSRSILRNIKTISDIPIVAFTGMGNDPGLIWRLYDDAGVDTIVDKSDHFEDDAAKIVDALARLLTAYARRPKEVQPPAIKVENGWTFVEVVVRVNTGAGIMAIWSLLKETKEYPREVVVIDTNNGKEKKYSVKGPLLTLMTAEMAEGKSVRLAVEGATQEAELLARKMYSILSCRYSFDLDPWKYAGVPRAVDKNELA